MTGKHAVAAGLAKPKRCKHRNVGTAHLQVGALIECPDCQEILSWQELAER